MSMISYDEYKLLVSDEVLNYIDFLIRLLANNNDFSIGDVNIGKTMSKIYYKLLFALSTDGKYKPFLNKYGVFINSINYGDYYNRVRDNNLDLFIYEDEKTKYVYQTPLKIFKNYINKLDEYDKGRPSRLFGYATEANYEKFLEELDELILEEDRELYTNLNINYFKNKKIEVIDYLDTVGSIHASLKRQGYDINDEHEARAIASLLALFEYNDVNKDFNVKNVLIPFLESKGLTKEKIMDTLGIKKLEIEKINKEDSLAYLITYYGFMEKNSKYTVDEVFNTLFKNPEENITILKILSSAGIDDDVLKEGLALVEEERQDKKGINLEEFYDGLTPLMIKYLNQISKIYTYLEKVTKDNMDGVILQNTTDLEPLAILINAYYNNSKVAKYFIDKGITLDTISKLLNINLDIKNIENIDVNEKVLLKIYNRYVNGVCTSKNNINIDTLNSALESYHFCKSRIIPRIYHEVTNEDLEEHFGSSMDRHFKTKEQKRAKELTEEFMLDLKPEVQYFLKMASHIYRDLNHAHSPLNNEDKKLISLLYSSLRAYENLSKIFLESNKDLRKYFGSYGIDAKGIYNLDKNLRKEKYETQIQVLNLHFKDFVFGGINKGKKREDITIESILENAFNKERYNSYTFSKYFSENKTSYEMFINLEENKNKYIKDLEEEQKLKRKQREEEEIKELVEYLTIQNESVLHVFEDATKIFNYIKMNQDKIKLVYKDKDIIEISLIIAFLQSESSYTKFFHHNGVTLDSILAKTNIPTTIIEDIEKIEPDMKMLKTHFGDYISNLRKDKECHKRAINLQNLCKNIFNDDVNDSIILETITRKTGNKYDDLKEEVMTGKEKEKQLTKDEIIEVLDKESAPEIDSDDMTALMLYGDDLSRHSSAISDELKELTLSSNLDDSLDNINELVNNIYTPKEEKKETGSFLSRLFGNKNVVVEKTREVNNGVISNLREEIDKNIDALNKELLGYDYLRKYVEVYTKKIDSYIEKVSKERESAYEKLHMYDPNDNEHYPEFLKYSTIVQILDDKLRRFETSKVLMKQELLKIHQVIVNHMITVNALKTSRDDIIPLIGSEMLISIGKQSETNALDLSNNLVGLFHNILSQNVEGTKENLNMLRSSELPESTVMKIEEDLKLYLSGADLLESTKEATQQKPLDIAYWEDESNLNDSNVTEPKQLTGPVSNYSGNNKVKAKKPTHTK